LPCCKLSGGRALYGTQIRNVRFCVGAYFPGHKVASGRHGVDSSLASRNGTIQPMVENGRTVGGGFMSMY
jgi:hypothetical protein